MTSCKGFFQRATTKCILKLKGCNGASNIAQTWRDDYSEIFNSVNDVSARDEVYDHLNNLCEMTHFVTVDDVYQFVANLKVKLVGKMVFPLSILLMPQSTYMFYYVYC